MRGFAEAQGVKLGQVAQPLRAALTGSTASPPIFEVMAVLGRDETLGRLRRCVERLTQARLIKSVPAAYAACHIAAQHAPYKDAPMAEPRPTPKPRRNRRQDRHAHRQLDRQISSCRSCPARSARNVVDIRKLYAEPDIFTFDPGFTSTGSCESKITYIDGDKGVLLYRGYPIEELAEHSDFLEVCYLLLNGELPTADREEEVRARHHLSHHGARAADALLSRLPPRRASDGGDVRRGRRAVGLLSRLAPTSTIRASAMIASLPPDRQDADDRRDGLQIFGRPALRLSAQRPATTPRISCA